MTHLYATIQIVGLAACGVWALTAGQWLGGGFVLVLTTCVVLSEIESKA